MRKRGVDRDGFDENIWMGKGNTIILCLVSVLIEQGLTSHQTHYRSYPG